MVEYHKSVARTRLSQAGGSAEKPSPSARQMRFLSLSETVGRNHYSARNKSFKAQKGRQGEAWPTTDLWYSTMRALAMPHPRSRSVQKDAPAAALPQSKPPQSRSRKRCLQKADHCKINSTLRRFHMGKRPKTLQKPVKYPATRAIACSFDAERTLRAASLQGSQIWFTCSRGAS